MPLIALPAAATSWMAAKMDRAGPAQERRADASLYLTPAPCDAVGAFCLLADGPSRPKPMLAPPPLYKAPVQPPLRERGW